jgi:hypothetical protein
MVFSVIRLENNLWGYATPPSEEQDHLTQIQIATPDWKQPRLSYLLAKMVAQTLSQKNIHTLQQLEDGFRLSVTNNDPPLMGRWDVSLVRHDHWTDAFFDFFPFTRPIRDKQIAVIKAIPESKCPFEAITRLFFKIAESQSFLIDQRVDPFTATLSVPLSLQEQLEVPLFDDAFTNLASLYLQTNSPFFVSEERVLGAYRFVFSQKDSLTLEEIPSGPYTEEEKEQNRRVSQFYKEFIVREFGKEKVEYVSCAYGFSLDSVIEQGDPLVPDHVFKVNIGMNNIELGDVQRLYYKLLVLKQRFDEATEVSLEDLFSLREIRNLQKQENILDFLQELASASSNVVQDLPPQLFNQLVDLIMPSDEERERALTGRKITHLAVRGALTLDGPDDFNASRDLFEMLHLYEQFRKDDWQNYLELLSHVAVKKNLFRKTVPIGNQSQDEWHVGFLFPGPTAADGEKRWYYNEAFFDDNYGSVNYVFFPACSRYENNGKVLPMIKAYRSTVSTLNQVNYLESFVADMNPYGSPNSLDPDSAYAYEKKYFDDRTIPAWVGYLLLGDRTGDLFMYERGLDEYLFCIHAPGPTPPHKMAYAHSLNETKDPQAIREFLFNEAMLHKELPQFKIAQDLFFTGHSLGGGLSQFAVYYFGPRRSRIPLPGCTFFCYASRAPAIDTHQDTVFMNFGKKHKALISGLNSKPWTVRQDLEYGDFVPEGGESHLGTTNYNEAEDAEWLQPRVTIFTPLETAKDLAITTISTHGRRTGNGVEGRDYSIKTLSANELATFDHSWWMTAETVSTFGFRLLRSPKIAEIFRDVVSRIAYPIWLLVIDIHNTLWPPIGNRDENGVWHLNYIPPEK